MTKVAVIGAGWSGLYALKYLLAEGIEVTCYEKANVIGGVWRIAQEQTVVASSSKTYMHPSDFPFDDSTDDFPTSKQVNEHLEKYADHFDLWDHIQLNSNVQSVEYINKKWYLLVEIDCVTHHIIVDKLVIAQGLAQKPYVPQHLSDMFSRLPCIHERNVQWNQQQPSWMSDGKVLVVGGGESAIDCAVRLASCTNKQVVLSFRTGRWLMNKLKQPSYLFPADVTSRKTFHMFKFDWFVNFFDWYLTKSFGVGLHGIKEWEPPKGVSSWGCFLNKRGDDAIPLIRKGKIVPAGGIRSIDNNNFVQFENTEQPHQISGVVFATGYHSKDNLLSWISPSEAYRHVFPTDSRFYASLAFIGAARPNLGSVSCMAEIASIWMAKVFSGKVTLPSIDNALQRIQADTDKRLKNFGKDGKNYPTLVRLIDYIDLVLGDLGMRYIVTGAPPVNLLWTYGLIKGARVWWSLYFVGWTPLEYLVLFDSNGKGLHTLETIKRMNKDRKCRSPDSLLCHMVKFATAWMAKSFMCWFKNMNFGIAVVIILLIMLLIYVVLNFI